MGCAVGSGKGWASGGGAIGWGLSSSGSFAWMWMRPNERRGCVGCHENRELAPDNHVALAIKKLPVEVVVTGTRHEEEGTRGLEHN